MIGMLRGKVWEIQTDKLVLDVQGTGYLLTVAYGLLSKLHSGQELVLYTHVVLREEELSLYGFSSLAEKEIFLQMLTVSGIGPKAALSILSTLGLTQAQSAIAGENLTMLTKVPGIGKKTAQRLVLELREKFKGKVGSGESYISLEGTGIQSEAVETLLALGFSLEEAKKALAQILTEGRELSVEEQVKEALGAIASQK
ncbi:Holliday junction branch migration protein RuvA [Desulfitobacterium metallireducens]|uniref:Holliday junction branch migration complex subunit RuvA n=1 Tax=Desulfitobacterium metallireducens DSM 15288 TaxID=871968 RepID=W0E9P0_9FIRM|nr:Holliday junction branch migration protein RuvA [Desulfitobacterium metallireducens]AHF07482.1 Holliday junction DNA helicase RuvA [Desulfitobacterium metallireducens DSM 15288]